MFSDIVIFRSSPIIVIPKSTLDVIFFLIECEFVLSDNRYLIDSDFVERFLIESDFVLCSKT